MNVIEFITVICVGILPGIVSSLVIAKESMDQLLYGKYSQVTVQIVQSMATVSLLVYIASQNSNGYQQLGLSYTLMGWWEVLILWVGLSLLTVYGYLIRTIQKQPKPNPVTLVMGQYDSLPTRCLYWLSMLVAVVAEDLLFRGYLVLWLGEKTGDLVTWAAISVALSIVSHLYQGVSRIGFHLIMASMLVLLAVVAGNIYLVIGVHLFWNTLQMLRFWQAMDRQKENQLAEKAAGMTDLS
jgi:membrane protease YdiL (CAAX protease family)